MQKFFFDRVSGTRSEFDYRRCELASVDRAAELVPGATREELLAAATWHWLRLDPRERIGFSLLALDPGPRCRGRDVAAWTAQSRTIPTPPSWR